MIYVNTVVLVQARLGLGEPQVALAFAAFGTGSIVAAFLFPRILERITDRPVMIASAGVMVAGVSVMPLASGLAGLMALWALVGFGFSLTQTPIGRIINRSAREADRGAVFAAQFALSHAAWLITYPLAGWLGSAFSLPVAAIALAGIGAIAMVAIVRLWPHVDPVEISHDHTDLSPDHPDLQVHAGSHRHELVIDPLHGHWPSQRG